MKPPTKISEEIEQLLRNLGLRRILEVYEEQLRAAEKEDVTYSEFFVRLLRTQWHARQEGALEWRIRRATLPERWSLETFPWTHQPGVNRKQIRAFAEPRVHRQSREHRLHRSNGCGQDRPRFRPSAQGPRERPPLSVRSRSGPVRRNVRLAG